MAIDKYAKYRNIAPPNEEEEETVQEPLVQQPEPKPMARELPQDKYTKYRNIPAAEEQEKPPEPAKKAPEKQKPGLGERFAQGVKESTSGQLAKVLQEKSQDPEALKEDPGFWESLVQSSGELVGDLPYFAAGATLGGALGAAGGPPGAIAGAGIGGFALNAFLKESLKQYHDFQDKGGDLTFGDFLQRADKVANKTIQEGAMGLVLGAVQKAIPLLKATPVGKLFDTKYIGKPLEKAAGLGLEATTATAVPALAQGELPSSEDIAKAGVLFVAPKLAGAIPGAIPKVINYLPEQLSSVMDRHRYGPINTALAEQISEQNLAYPTLYELKGDVAALEKNSVALDRNIAAFDASYVQQFTDKINNLSPEDLPSAREAGIRLHDTLYGVTPETQLREPTPVEKAGIKVSPQEPSRQSLAGRGTEAPTTEGALKTAENEGNLFPGLREQPTTQTPQKPTKSNRELPAAQNPMVQGIQTISDRGFESDVKAGKEISEQFHKIRDEQKAPLEKRYETLEQAADGIVVLDEGLAREARDFIDKYEGSAVPNSPENQVISKAKRLLGTLAEVGEEGEITGTKDVNVKDLIKTNQSLKKVPNWNLPGDFRKVLGELIEATDRAIEKHLDRSNPELASEYKALNNDYRMFKQRFDNSATRVFFDPTAKDQAIYNKFSSIDSFNQVSEALSMTPEGEQTLNKLRRDVWEKKIGDKTLGAKTEGDFVEGLSKLNEREFNNLMEYLTPEQRVELNGRVKEVNRIRESVNQAEQEYNTAKENYESGVQQKINAKELEKLNKEKEKRKEAYYKSRESLKNNRVKDLRKSVDHRQDLLVSLLKQDPAEIARNMSTEEGILRTREMSKKVSGGNEMFKALARYQTDQMFDFVKTSYNETGRVPYNKIKTAMNNKDFRAKLKAMNGQEFVNSIDELVKITDQLSPRYKTLQLKYINDPATYQAIIDTATALGLAHGELTMPLLLQTGKKVGLQKAEIWWKKTNYTQEGIKKAVKAARALQSGDKKAITEAAKSL